jgi:hypothetical protein
VVAVISVGESTTTFEAGIAVGPAPLPCAISTVAPATKLVPMILIEVPPLTDPDDGLTEETVGLAEIAASGLNAAIPSGVPTPVGPS